MYSVAIHEHQHNHPHLNLASDLHNRPPIPMDPHPHQHHPPPPPQPPPSSNPNRDPNKDRQVVVGIPAVIATGTQLVIGDADTSQSHFRHYSYFDSFSHCLSYLHLASTRSWTSLKVVGDGSFGTVWLCDWHSALPPNTPLSPMQCGAGARPEWSGKRLVAVKRMKKRWEGGWDECRRLKELEVCSTPPSACMIPRADFSRLLPSVSTGNFVSSEYHSLIRFVSSAVHEGAIFRI